MPTKSQILGLGSSLTSAPYPCANTVVVTPRYTNAVAVMAIEINGEALNNVPGAVRFVVEQFRQNGGWQNFQLAVFDGSYKRVSATVEGADGSYSSSEYFYTNYLSSGAYDKDGPMLESNFQDLWNICAWNQCIGFLDSDFTFYPNLLKNPDCLGSSPTPVYYTRWACVDNSPQSFQTTDAMEGYASASEVPNCSLPSSTSDPCLFYDFETQFDEQEDTFKIHCFVLKQPVDGWILTLEYKLNNLLQDSPLIFPDFKEGYGEILRWEVLKKEGEHIFNLKWSKTIS